jgi:AcrR family transcriptional regulator
MSGNAEATSEPPTDRRVRRTRELLRRALLELILEKGYDRITVRDILDRADVGRSTFYAHYRDKDELLLAGFEDVHTAIHAERDAAEAGRTTESPFLEPLLAMFSHVGEHRHFWEALSRKGGADVITRILRRSVDELVREHLRARFPEAAQDPTRLEPAIRFTAGACMGMLVWWLDTGDPMTSEEIHAMYARLATIGVRRSLAR